MKSTKKLCAKQNHRDLWCHLSPFRWQSRQKKTIQFPFVDHEYRGLFNKHQTTTPIEYNSLQSTISAHSSILSGENFCILLWPLTMTWVRIHNVVATKHLSLWCGCVRLLLLRKSKELSITNDNYRCLVRQVCFPFIIRSIERQREYPNKQQWQRIELLLHSSARCALLAHRTDDTDDHQGSLHKCTLWKPPLPSVSLCHQSENFRCEHERGNGVDVWIPRGCHLSTCFVY